MATTMTPRGKDAVSVRHISTTKEDRAKDLGDFKERKKQEQILKEQRFSKIKERRKGRKPSGGNNGGINIDVTSDH